MTNEDVRKNQVIENIALAAWRVLNHDNDYDDTKDHNVAMRKNTIDAVKHELRGWKLVRETPKRQRETPNPYDLGEGIKGFRRHG